jgi:hypothetical protein
MIKQLLFKWFGLEELPCDTCEVLREQLANSERERRELLNRLLEPSKPEPPSTDPEELKPIMPQFIPWRIRQQMLEQEDRRAAKIMKDRKAEIEQLEKEMGIAKEIARGESGGVKSDVY